MKNKPHSPVTDSRCAALATLLLTEKGVAVQEALDQIFSRCELSVADRAQASEFAYGVLRTRIALDARLVQVLPRPEKLPLPVQLILALGLYSLLYAERIPAHAAINTAVELAKKRAGQRMGNLVNATLRKLLREPVRIKTADVWRTLATQYALPDDILHLWRKHYGSGASLSLLRRSFSRPWPCVRINARHELASELRENLAGEPFATAVGQWGFAFPPGALPQRIGNYSVAEFREKGVLSHQAAGSQLLLEKLGLFALEGPFWDCCAGVGGKSLPLLERGRVVAQCSDTSGKRLKQLARDCQRLGLACSRVHEADATKYAPEDFTGHILVDAPCSSMGVLARRPDVKKRSFASASLQHFVAMQRAILDNVAHSLAPGYCLAYMTCTLNPAENEVQIETFLARHPNFCLLSQWQTPHEHPWLEGMFGALLQKTY